MEIDGKAYLMRTDLQGSAHVENESYGIIQQHDGAIDVKSKLGRGAIFMLKFPLEEKGDDDRNDKEAQ